MTSENVPTGERADLLQSLMTTRSFLRHTARGLSDGDAARRTTVSELCVGGLIKHVTDVERSWATFIVEGPSAVAPVDDASYNAYSDGFRMLEGETLAALLEQYERVAEDTDELISSTPDLDRSHPLPEAPWFQPGARWSARHTVLHIIAETAQHAGHADIIRESLDGAKTMG
jgi:uncharacterized damage-inducible protein DinB